MADPFCSHVNHILIHSDKSQLIQIPHYQILIFFCLHIHHNFFQLWTFDGLDSGLMPKCSGSTLKSKRSITLTFRLVQISTNTAIARINHYSDLIRHLTHQQLKQMSRNGHFIFLKFKKIV